MQATVENFATYRAGPNSYALGHLVIPVARLEELGAALPGDVDFPWRVSALMSGNLDTDFAAISEFNRQFAGRARIDTVELRVQSPEKIETAATQLPEELDAYFEIPVADDPSAFIAAIGAARQRAKIRTGGVTPDAFPQAVEIVRFLDLCAHANVPFKATAGLHHPLYSHRPLTYSADAPQGWMFGFMNVFLAAAWIRLGMDPKAIAPLLEEQDPSALRVSTGEVSWRVFRLTGAQVEDIRNRFALSFGSCSFEEPIADLQSLGWLKDMSW